MNMNEQSMSKWIDEKNEWMKKQTEQMKEWLKKEWMDEW